MITTFKNEPTAHKCLTKVHIYCRPLLALTSSGGTPVHQYHMLNPVALLSSVQVAGTQMQPAEGVSVQVDISAHTGGVGHTGEQAVLTVINAILPGPTLGPSVSFAFKDRGQTA